MTKILKETSEVITVIKQFRNQSNNYLGDTKIFADLYKVRKNDGSVRVYCQNDLE